jgi:hypothetical protein
MDSTIICLFCHGKGQSECDTCKGTMDLGAEICNKCPPEKDKKCYYCNNFGYYKKGCTVCISGQKICYHCFGKGKIEKKYNHFDFTKQF